MEEKKPIKISLKMAIFMILITISIVVISTIVIINKINDKSSISTEDLSKNISTKTFKNEKYYIIEDDYNGEYDLQYVNLSEYWEESSEIKEQFEKQTIMNFKEYKSYCEEWNLIQEYTDFTKNYIVFSYMSQGYPSLEARLAEVEYIEDDVILYIWDDAYGFSADVSAYVVIIPTDKEINKINVQPLYTKSEYNNLIKYGTIYDPGRSMVDKPIIYLYPEEETEVSVELGYPELITCSYPKYINNGWKVQAQPNGDLIDLFTNRNLYALYYESKSVIDFKVEDEGFIVKGTETVQFFEEKLALLGLTEREAEEFIVYWLPKLEANEYNYIRFASIEEINENMPLNVEPNPDTVIRILMTYKGLDEPIEVQEQEIETPERNGFVVVEWGGTEIK